MVRVVEAGWGTLSEINEHWSLEDVWDAHAVLNLRERARAKAIEKAKKK